MFDNIRADLRRAQRVNSEGLVRQLLNPGTQAVLVYRLGHWISRFRPAVLRRILLALYLPLQWITRLFTGVNIATAAEIGPGLVIHTWSGVFIPPCRIGRNAVFAHGVVINWDCQEIGDDVSFGPGAKVIRPVRIGDRVRVGANAVVWQNVPDDATVVGIPGKILRLRRPPPTATSESGGAMAAGAGDDAYGVPEPRGPTSGRSPLSRRSASGT